MVMQTRHSVQYGTSINTQTDQPIVVNAVPVRGLHFWVTVNVRRPRPANYKTAGALPQSFNRSNTDESFMGSILSVRYNVLPPNVPGGPWRNLTGTSSGAIGYGPNSWNDEFLAKVRGDEVDLEGRCLELLYEQIRGTLDLAIDIAEAHQTKAMFSDFSKVSKFMRNIPVYILNRGVNPIGALKAVGSLWLTWQYGIRPLLSSVYETANQILNGDKLDGLMTVKAKSKTRKIVRGKKVITDFQTIYYTAESNARMEYITHWKFRPEDQVVFSTFSSLNPASILWETLPFSFVADWFINVGRYLRSCESAALYGTAFLRGSRSYGTKEYVDQTLSISYTGIDGFDSGSGVAYHNSTSKERTIVFSVGLIPRPPRFNLRLGAQRLFSAASLLSNFLKKRELAPEPKRIYVRPIVEGGKPPVRWPKGHRN